MRHIRTSYWVLYLGVLNTKSYWIQSSMFFTVRLESIFPEEIAATLSVSYNHSTSNNNSSKTTIPTHNIAVMISYFSVICYLATFALDDLGFQNFTNIVKSLDIKNIELVRHIILNILIIHILLSSSSSPYYCCYYYYHVLINILL